MSAAYEPRPPLLRVSAVSKHYAAPVLRDIDLDVHAGEVLALTGENGAGKSTLSKILCGLETATSGSMTLAGTLYAPDSRSSAEALGVRMVLQELSMVPTLSVAENLFLGNLPRRLGWIDRPTLRRQAEQALARVGLDLDPWTPVHTLGVGHQQMIEIARALASACRMLILDEPTAMLSAHESATLFERIDALRRDGVAVIYISHRLDELARIADRIVVLRDGKLVTDAPAATVTQDALIQAMVGRDVAASSETQRAAREPWLGDGSPALRVTGLTRAPAVRDVSFDVAPGEIFGIAGLVGAGRTELAHLIFGGQPRTRGEVKLGDKTFGAHSPRDAIDAGLVYLTEDRKRQGLFLDMSVRDNINISVANRDAQGGVLNLARGAERARDAISSLSIRVPHANVNAGALSGGNQQKVLLSRLLETKPRVLILDEPTRGVDIGAKSEIYRIINQLARAGVGVIVISSELPELIGIADRVLVIREGTIAGELGGYTGQPITQEAIIALATGSQTALAQAH